MLQLNRRLQREFLAVDHNFYKSWPGWLSAWARMGRSCSGPFVFSPSGPQPRPFLRNPDCDSSRRRVVRRVIRTTHRLTFGAKQERCTNYFLVLDFGALCSVSAMKFLKRTLTTLFLVLSVPLILVVSLAAAGWNKIKTKLTGAGR